MIHIPAHWDADSSEAMNKIVTNNIYQQFTNNCMRSTGQWENVVTKQLENAGHAQEINNNMGDNIWDNIQHILSWMQKCSFFWNNDRVHLTPAHENNLAEVRFIIQGTSLLCSKCPKTRQYLQDRKAGARC